MSAIDRDFAVADLDGVLAEHGGRRAVLVQANNTLAETRFLLDAAAASTNDHVVVGWVDVAADVPAQLADFEQHSAAERLVGVRHLAHVDPDPQWLARRDVVTGLKALARAGMSFDLVVRAHQLPHAAILAEQVPELRLVLDHLGNPPAEGSARQQWGADLQRLAQYPNVAAKVSGLEPASGASERALTAVDATVDIALETFGPTRLMFGSDWPLVRLSDGGYAGWLERVRRATAALSANERGHIFSGTAQTFYGIAL